MKILINISEQPQAESFLKWVENRGDILLGSLFDVESYSKEDTSQPAYVNINSAQEVTGNVRFTSREEDIKKEIERLQQELGELTDKVGYDIKDRSKSGDRCITG
jgi:cob(I)alamin adenosyltransferase